ncbi:DUF2232 domain-containing protein [Aureibacillus halotolerans]|uniref:Uncharacterized protein YybS (DUF2232 family) n=1 Tax=Aureibacillus halotolerans TaxID=1508390 RepID=A0A4R6U1R1_9BACI|nr:DUF2232 domain-containing protein [Aureibacillus halotolerans]TDQ38359.1 uncharacterized protein YybS (DUF2232 family) [Aureibacillus halotolerans]
MTISNVVKEGFLLFLLYFALLLIGVNSPFFALIWMLLPLPFAVHASRHGVKAGGALGLIAIVASSLVYVYVGLFAIPAVVLGVGIGHWVMSKKSPFFIWAYSALIYVAMSIATVLTLTFVFQMDVNALYEANMEQTLAMSQQTFQSLGDDFAQEQADVLRAGFEEMRQLMPTLVAGSCAMLGWLTTILTLSVLKTTSPEKPRAWEPFRNWQFPKGYAIFYIIVSLLTMFINDDSAFSVMLLNIFAVLLVLMAIQGFSFIFYFCRVKGYSKAIPIIVTIVSLLFSFITLFLIRFIGVFDLIFQLRSRLKSGK